MRIYSPNQKDYDQNSGLHAQIKGLPNSKGENCDGDTFSSSVSSSKSAILVQQSGNKANGVAM